MFFRANDISGARYIALKVANIEEAFEYIKSQSDVTLINTSEEYRVFKLSKVKPSQIKFFDPEKESNPYIAMACNGNMNRKLWISAIWDNTGRMDGLC